MTLQKTAVEVADLLSKEGLEARAYHAGLDDAIRSEVQDWFMSCDQGIVVATIAFGMGVDKSNVRNIIHYNPSKSIENLAQEIERAGRDGEPAICETLLVPEDRVVLENFPYGDTPSVASVRKFVELLRGQPNQFFVSYYSLAYETDMRDSVVRSLLTYLELQGYSNRQPHDTSATSSNRGPLRSVSSISSAANRARSRHPCWPCRSRKKPTSKSFFRKLLTD